MADAVGPSPPTAETLSALGLAAGDAATSAAKDWDSVSSAANEALSIVKPGDTNEVKAYQKPSADVCDVLFAAMVCLGYPDTEMTWPKARKMLLSLIQQCKDFDSKTVDKAMIRRLKPWMAKPALKDVEYAARVSKAIKSVAMWVQAVYEYGS